MRDWRHQIISELYKTPTCDEFQLRIVIVNLPTLLLVPPFTEQCAPALIDHDDAKQVLRVAKLVLRCKITPESTRLLSLCFSSFNGLVLKLGLSGPYAGMRPKWNKFRERARKSAWASLFHGEKPWQIKEELRRRTGMFPLSIKIPKRDKSPKRN